MGHRHVTTLRLRHWLLLLSHLRPYAKGLLQKQGLERLASKVKVVKSSAAPAVLPLRSIIVKGVEQEYDGKERK